MRELECREQDHVSGGDWSFELNFGFGKVTVSGEETVQEIAGGAYWAARDATADFFGMIDPNSWFASMSGCNGGGGGR